MARAIGCSLRRLKHMSHSLIYGKFNLYQKQTKEEIVNLTYDLLLKSIKHKFGLIFSSNLPMYLINKMDSKVLMSEECLVYEITDDPIWDECYKIFDGIWIGQDDFVGIEDSRLYALQEFLSDILSHVMISSIEFCMEDVHGDEMAGSTSYTIKANELVKVISTAPRIHTEMPNVQVLITK